METRSALRARLLQVASAAMSFRAACTVEESAKLYLVLPVLAALGYNSSDPFEVQPEAVADFRNQALDRVDFVILRDGLPTIAIECKAVGVELEPNRGQLRGYFSALGSVKLGILTNGIIFEFFVDSEQPNIMDAEPFLTLDLDEVARGNLPADVLEALTLVTKEHFRGDEIADLATIRLIAKKLRAVMSEELRNPSEEFCRMVLQRVGIKSVRKASIQSRYSSLVKTAFEEALVMPVLEALRAASASELAANRSGPEDDTSQKIVTTDRELSVYRYVCRRLAFLSATEAQFAAIEKVAYKDYIGKFVVYFEGVKKGRLFDFVAGENGFDKFIFPDPFGEIVTNSISDIDSALQKTFEKRVSELGGFRSSLYSPREAVAATG